MLRLIAIVVLVGAAIGCGDRVSSPGRVSTSDEPGWVDGVKQIPLVDGMGANVRGAQGWNFEYRLSSPATARIDQKMWGPGRELFDTSTSAREGRHATGSLRLLVARAPEGSAQDRARTLSDAPDLQAVRVQHLLAGSGVEQVLLVSSGEAYAHAVDATSALYDNLLLFVAWGRREGVPRSVSPVTLKDAVAAFESGVAWYLRFDYEIRMRVVAAVADTLLQRVRAEIWRWTDGDEGTADEWYGRWMQRDAAEADVLARFHVSVEISRRALGDPAHAAPEEAEAEPIRVRIVVRDEAQPEPPQLVREGMATEAAARAMDHDALLAAFRERWESIGDDLKVLAR